MIEDPSALQAVYLLSGLLKTAGRVIELDRQVFESAGCVFVIGNYSESAGCVFVIGDTSRLQSR